MKRKLFFSVVLMTLLVLFYGISFSEEIDLSGTWEGTTEVPDSDELDKVTLILEKVEGKYRGTVSDSLGMISDGELKDVKFEDDELSFNFTVFDGYNYSQIYAVFTIEGDEMSGTWKTEDGQNSASLELKKVK